MAQSKPTPGPWFVSETLAVGPAGQIIACVRTDHPQAQANARLFAEAGTVAHETGLTPRQLAEQRAELLVVLKDMRAAWIKGRDGDNVFAEHANAMQAAIGKAEGGAS